MSMPDNEFDEFHLEIQNKVKGKFIELEYDSEVDTTVKIQLTEEPYNGIVYSYGKVKFLEEEVNDEAILQFDYDVHDNPNELKLEEDKQFKEQIGHILTWYILQREGEIRENRTTDSE